MSATDYRTLIDLDEPGDTVATLEVSDGKTLEMSVRDPQDMISWNMEADELRNFIHALESALDTMEH